ncbi:HNH endonuclease [Enteractinococcus helveticum]
MTTSAARPHCETPIQEVDHSTAHRDGGTTTWDNATALCGV